jgi:hypothetical protein
MWQICMRNSCDAEAAYSIKALIPLIGHELYEGPLEYFCGLKLCPACANGIKPYELFNGEVRNCLRQMLRCQGSPESPDFERAKLILISINDLQLLQLEAQNATIH